MTDTTDPIAAARRALLEAALPNVVFDGWSRETLDRACEDAGIDAQTAAMAFPRGPVDMALAFHDQMDEALRAELAGDEMAAMKVRERVTHGVRRRIELVAEEREAVRRGATLLSLPVYAADSARAIWQTADIIWTAAGDTAEDYNWYTKRAILSGVYSSTLLYWLGDESDDSEATWAFLDRRIDNVMQFERVKGAVQKNPLARAMLAPASAALSIIRAPRSARGGGGGGGGGGDAAAGARRSSCVLPGVGRTAPPAEA
ncbi:MAG: COQ9 family protein [Pseudomonadota bacterium]